MGIIRKIKRDWRKFKVTQLLVPISIGLMIFVATLFGNYEKLTQESLQATALNGVTLLSSDISRQAYSYLESQSKNMQTIKNMCKDSKLDTDETLDLVLNSSTLECNFLFIDPETYSGYELDTENSEKNEIDVSDVQALVDACEGNNVTTLTSEDSELDTSDTDVSAMPGSKPGNGPSISSTTESDETGEDDSSEASEETDSANANQPSDDSKQKLFSQSFSLTDTNVTEIFSLDGKNYNLALYETITIEEKEYMLFYVISMEQLMDGIWSNLSDFYEDALFMDYDGNVYYYDYGDDTDEKVDNFLDLIEDSYGSDTREEWDEELSAATDGVISVNKGTETLVYTFCDISTVDNLVFVTQVDSNSIDEILDTSSITISNNWMVMLMVLPLILDVLIITIQNLLMSRKSHQLKVTNASLKRANEAQNIFISNMSHEIRTPINAVLGMDEMIIRETTEPEIKNYAVNIKHAGKTLLGIVNNILDYTKMEAGKIEIVETEYEVGNLVNDLRNLVQKRMDDKNLVFEISADESLPKTLKGDELRIQQIILNILTNAAKYTEEGSVKFSITNEGQTKEYVSIKVTVADTGIGMKKEEMDKLYKPFERMDVERNRTIEGTGLGMSICTKLLNIMGSELQVESEYGKGSTFSFVLKQQVVNSEKLKDIENYLIETKDEEEEQAQLHASKARILVVDDTEVNITVVEGLLKRTMIKSDKANSGQEALNLCRENKYDVILLDHRMPGMDGVETLEHLRSEEGLNKDTIVICLTANVASGSGDYYFSVGFNDYLAKPVNGLKLERMLLKYLPEDKLDTEDDIASAIDREEAVKLSGTVELYEQVARDYLKTIEFNLQVIRELYAAKDIENLTIKIHALKSSARLVGAMGLSAEALYMEECGNQGKVDEIDKGIDKLLNHANLATKNLKEMFPDKDTSNLPEIDEVQLKEILGAMKEFVAVFDFDQLDFCIQSLENYRMPEDKAAEIEELKAAVSDVNDAKINEILAKLL